MRPDRTTSLAVRFPLLIWSEEDNLIIPPDDSRGVAFYVDPPNQPGLHRDHFKTWARRIAAELVMQGFPMSEAVLSHLPREYQSDSGSCIRLRCLTCHSEIGFAQHPGGQRLGGLERHRGGAQSGESRAGQLRHGGGAQSVESRAGQLGYGGGASVSSKRGPKSKEALLVSLKAMTEERNDYRGQLRRRETDFENRTRAQHSAQVIKLESTIEMEKYSVRKFKEHSIRDKSETDKAVALLAAERISAEGERCEAGRIAAMQFKNAIGVKERVIAARDVKLSQQNDKIVELNQRIAELETLNADRLTTLRSQAGKLGGRPAISRTQEEQDNLGGGSTAQKSKQSMAARIAGVIGVVETATEISIDSLMEALKAGGYLDSIWESKLIWEFRMEWLKESKDVLALRWDVGLTMRARDKLGISYDKTDELRFIFSHHRVGKQLKPIPWVINPWNGNHISFPQPIRPGSGALGWAQLVSAAQKRYGLSMDKSGRIAQRSYLTTVALQVERDLARGLLRPITDADPLIAVLGADGTGVGKRSMMHVANSIAPSYRDGVSVENEKNLSTIATSVTDDHWSGLNETLCGGFYTGDGDGELPPTSIAAEINSMIADQCVTISDPDGTKRDVPARARGSFDLVAARGIRGGRGRCACHVEADDKERFGVPPIKEDTTWAEASVMLEKHPLLKSADLRSDSHTPPAHWDWTKPWKCPRAGCSVEFKSKLQFLEARSTFLSAKADRSTDGKVTTAKRAKLYAELHPSQQGEFEPPLTDLDMADIIIDALHCLMLNLPKVIWNYTFGDRMTNEQRELVAEYLTLIGCPLDVRAKGDGRDANRKWFTGEIFQRFVEGDGHSPGLAANITAIFDIIYVKAPAPVVVAPVVASDNAPASKNTVARNGGGGAKKRKGGDSMFADVPASTAAPAKDAIPAVSPADDSVQEAKLRQKYGSHMDVVKVGIDAWRELGLVYAEWRTPWEASNKEYRETRALEFLRCATRLSAAMKACSLNKHKSWYAFLIVWVVPRQMARDGDTWAFGTSPVEQRGARLKKFVRQVVSWRPCDDGMVIPAGPALADGSTLTPVFVPRRKYESCAMMQVLRMCVSQEEMWAASALETARTGVDTLSVSERRMQTAGRSTLLKIERGKGLRLPQMKEEVIDLT